MPSHEPREKKIASSMQMLHLTTAMMKKTQTGGYQSLVTMASTAIAQFFGAKIVTSSAKETLLQALPTSSQTCVASAASLLEIIEDHWIQVCFHCFHCHFSPSPYQIQDQDLCLDTSSSGTKHVSSRPRGSPGPLDIRQLLATRHAFGMKRQCTVMECILFIFVAWF